MSSKKGGNAKPLKQPKADKEDDESNMLRPDEARSGNGQGPPVEPECSVEVMRGMLESQKQQIEEQATKIQQQEAKLIQQATLIQEQLAMLIQQYTSQEETGVYQFLEMHPKRFSGKESPLEAEEWASITKDYLVAARVPEDGWVDAAKLLLTNGARIWWEEEEIDLVRPISWGIFCERFDAMYFPLTAKMDLQDRFINLRQGSMWTKSVDEYDNEFLMLSRFAPQMVADPIHCAMRFLRGLDPEIQSSMTAVQMNTYEEVRRAARKYEALVKQHGGIQSGGNTCHVASGNTSNRLMHTTQFKKARAPVNAQRLVCHHCGKLGHHKKDCQDDA